MYVYIRHMSVSIVLHSAECSSNKIQRVSLRQVSLCPPGSYNKRMETRLDVNRFQTGRAAQSLIIRRHRHKTREPVDCVKTLLLVIHPPPPTSNKRTYIHTHTHKKKTTYSPVYKISSKVAQRTFTHWGYADRPNIVEGLFIIDLKQCAENDWYIVLSIHISGKS